MQNHLGRKLGRFEVVHHINGNKEDNRLKNLEVKSLSEHSKEHMKILYQDDNLRKNRKSLSIIRNKKFRLPHTKNSFTCYGCRKIKNKNEFWKNKNNLWKGIRNYCIVCEKEMYKIKKIKQ